MTDKASLTEFEALDIGPLIAARPADPRDSAGLITLDRAGGPVGHRTFRDLPDLLRTGDVMVLNRSRVWKAKLPARKSTGGNSELLLIRPETPDLKSWSALVRKTEPGCKIICRGGSEAVCVSRNADGSFVLDFSLPLDFGYLEKNAEVPLPGYILKARKRTEGPESAAHEFTPAPVPASGDESGYQTVFADEPGSIAAPTAGFHFTPELLQKIMARGIEVRYVTLHIGWGTFKPVRGEGPAAHTMLDETCSVTEETAAALNAARERGARIIAVGTSSMRTLETFSDNAGRLSSGEAKAGLFIYPGYRFRVAGAFITNLHVPSSAPLYMTAAFAGRERLFCAYREAVEKKYRFYSYGDAMLIT